MSLRIHLLLLALFGTQLCSAQQSIKVKKQFQFYPVIPLSDTLLRNTKPRFYLIVPETLKRSVSVFIENGKLDAGENDSVVSFSYLAGMRYELIFVKEEGQARLRPKSLVNGASALPKNEVRIEAVNKKEDKVLQTMDWIVR